jgi:hypothetical protein
MGKMENDVKNVINAGLKSFGMPQLDTLLHDKPKDTATEIHDLRKELQEVKGELKARNDKEAQIAEQQKAAAEQKQLNEKIGKAVQSLTGAKGRVTGDNLANFKNFSDAEKQMILDTFKQVHGGREISSYLTPTAKESLLKFYGDSPKFTAQKNEVAKSMASDVEPEKAAELLKKYPTVGKEGRLALASKGMDTYYYPASKEESQRRVEVMSTLSRGERQELVNTYVDNKSHLPLKGNLSPQLAAAVDGSPEAKQVADILLSARLDSNFNRSYTDTKAVEKVMAEIKTPEQYAALDKKFQEMYQGQPQMDLKTYLAQNMERNESAPTIEKITKLESQKNNSVIADVKKDRDEAEHQAAVSYDAEMEQTRKANEANTLREAAEDRLKEANATIAQLKEQNAAEKTVINSHIKADTQLSANYMKKHEGEPLVKLIGEYEDARKSDNPAAKIDHLKKSVEGMSQEQMADAIKKLEGAKPRTAVQEEFKRDMLALLHSPKEFTVETLNISESAIVEDQMKDKNKIVSKAA